VEITLRNHVAVVTGASSGIGRAVALAFLECGVEGLVAVDRCPLPPDLGERMPNGKVVFIQGDVGEESTAIAFTETALREFGKLDILVNNAGMSVVKPIHEHTPEEWDAVMNSNVKAVYWAARHVIPVMMRQGGGVILNSGSISGQVGIPTQGAYGPSKGALHQITRQMAIEYAPHGIRVNAICCGTVDTPIVHRSAEASGDPDAYWGMLRRGHPVGRIASAAEVAKFFAYMASDDAGFFTGSILMMDGGFTAQ
jgi:NAD(P)-dependent dehydrogenase (short-subunit alcohol dehydrogenase family)